MKAVSVLALALLLVASVACGSGDPTPTPTVPPTRRPANTIAPAPALAAATDVPTSEVLVELPTRTPRPTRIPPTDAPQEITALTTIDLKVRTGPGTAYSQVDVLKKGTVVRLLGISEDQGWFQHEIGWSSAEYLTTEADTSQLLVILVEPPPTSVPTPAPPILPTSAPTSAPQQDAPPPTAKPPTSEPPQALLASGQVVISLILFDGDVPRTESDEYAEIRNISATPVELTGWHLNAGDPGQDFHFPDGFVLQSGQACRVYTNEAHPETCGFSYGSRQARWNNDGDCGLLYDREGVLVSQKCY